MSSSRINPHLAVSLHLAELIHIILVFKLNFLIPCLLSNRASLSIKKRHAATLLWCGNWTASKITLELIYATQKSLCSQCLQEMSTNGRCGRACLYEHLQGWDL